MFAFIAWLESGFIAFNSVMGHFPSFYNFYAGHSRRAPDKCD